MWTDVVDLRDFYNTTLGAVAQRMIRRAIRQTWPDVRAMNVLGIGFTTPYLGPFRPEASRVMAAMPAAQGVLHWPGETDGLTTLVEEFELPFADMSVDRVLLVHALECTENVRPMMREVWRVLSGGGRLIVVVPNRRGVWTRFERTPFGRGRPYSPRQLSQVLRENMFTPVQTRGALFTPPTASRLALTSAAAIEEIGERWFNGFSGVVITEATKQIYAGHTEAKKRARFVRVPQHSPDISTRG
ncbi:MAG: methyltransferase domain-containing protein [Rhodospirillaceae bacterium]|nr:methyltransferase domain-containing protein [Rhodospirillaceae bacterium]